MSCTYCVPHSSPLILNQNDKNWSNADSEEPLTASKLNGLIRMLIDQLPIREVKLTGGEPLISPLLKPIISELRKYENVAKSLTTNGVHLASMASFLKEKGIHNINVSLDAIDPVVFSALTRTNGLKHVKKGIDVALELGLKLKINCVIVKGVNESGILSLLDYAGQKGITIRYLEIMEMGALFGKAKDLIFTQDEILQVIQSKAKITPVVREASSTANYWETSKGYKFGIIANHSVPFCCDCNRLRLDSTGKIFGCITDDTGIDASKITNPKDLANILTQALLRKRNKFTGSKRSMISLGG